MANGFEPAHLAIPTTALLYDPPLRAEDLIPRRLPTGSAGLLISRSDESASMETGPHLSI